MQILIHKIINKKQILLVLALFLPIIALSNGIKPDTVAVQKQMIIVERDTVLSVQDTVFAGNYAIKITTKQIKTKIFDTIYVNNKLLTNAVNPNNIAYSQTNTTDDDIIDNDDYDSEENEETDFGGDEDFYDENTTKLLDENIDYEVPASDIYNIWVNSSVNPYKVNITTIKDTVSFDMSEFVYPLVKPMHVTSRFGFRRRRPHNGIDLKLYVGDTVVAPMRGMVRITGNAGKRKGYGKYVVIRHYNGLETVYGHLTEINVEPNQIVAPGDIIGLGGNTGRSYGSHLHWEFRYLGNPINPEEIIDFETYQPKSEIYHLINKKTFNHIIEQGKVKYWTVKKGDTLSRIASNTGTSVKQLCALNRITPKSILQIGQKIRYN
jgi:murein DD-endopeptidase MepM/ murein hydrolase activator NlpD